MEVNNILKIFVKTNYSLIVILPAYTPISIKVASEKNDA